MQSIARLTSPARPSPMMPEIPQPKAGQPGAPSAGEVPVIPSEDLMREHGLLKRVLLIYREGIRRLQAGDQAPSQALNAGAGIIRSFIEEHHEDLGEHLC